MESLPPEKSRPRLPVVPIKPSTLADRVYGTVQRLLVTGALDAGSRINEVHLAEDLGVSRGTLRVACRRLVQDGLLVEVSNRGTFVATFGLADLSELTDLRMALETLAMRLLRARGVTIGVVEERLQELELACEQKELLAIQEAEYRFHLALFEQAGNSHLLDAYEVVRNRLRLATAPFEREVDDLVGSGIRHRPLLEAMRSASDAEAVFLTEQHIRDHAQRLAGRMASNPPDLVPCLDSWSK